MEEVEAVPVFLQVGQHRVQRLRVLPQVGPFICVARAVQGVVGDGQQQAGEGEFLSGEFAGQPPDSCGLLEYFAQ